MFKMLNKDMEDVKKTQIKLLKLKITMYNMRNVLGGINSRLDIGE